jgi:hypothetical protein
MDMDAAWPYRLETQRSSIGRPRSIGLRCSGPDGAEGQIVLYADGRANVDYVAAGGDTLKSAYVGLDDPRELGSVLMRMCAQMLAPTAHGWIPRLGGAAGAR